MKKKLSLFITLALATFLTTGCEALDSILHPSQDSQTEETHEEQKNEEEKTPEKPSVKGIKLDYQQINLSVGEEYVIGASVIPENANQDLSFISENDNICTVSSLGLVSAVNSGQTNIIISSVENEQIYEYLSVSVDEEEIPGTNYTVSFNANGGTGQMENQTTNGSSYHVPECGFSFSGHSFDGWALNSATGTKCAVGSTITEITSDITLYATWRDNSVPVTNYTVSFNANGGSGTMSSQTTNGNMYVTPSCTFTPQSGYSFKEWALNSASGTRYAIGATISDILSNITLFAIWKENINSDYYSSISATSGIALLGQLHDLSVTKHTKYNSYSEDSTTNYIKTDQYESSNYVMDFYSGAPTSNTVQSGGDSGWNREHVWCQSLSNGLYGKSGAGADIQHIRPTIPKLNSDRGDKKYGELNNSGTPSTSKDVNNNTVYGGYYSGDVFQPMANRKGDVARIIMYLYMHYNTYANVGGTKDGLADTGTLNFTFVMAPSTESAAKQLLMNWNNADPVDDIERKRNEEAAKITGCRNPFIDHPEYANMIWGS